METKYDVTKSVITQGWEVHPRPRPRTRPRPRPRAARAFVSFAAFLTFIAAEAFIAGAMTPARADDELSLDGRGA